MSKAGHSCPIQRLAAATIFAPLSVVRHTYCVRFKFHTSNVDSSASDNVCCSSKGSYCTKTFYYSPAYNDGTAVLDIYM